MGRPIVPRSQPPRGAAESRDIVIAGCYVTAGSKLTLPDGTVVRAAELSGQSDVLFWRNSVTGVLEARPRGGARIELNAALHAND